jgi:hypothetical protein
MEYFLETIKFVYTKWFGSSIGAGEICNKNYFPEMLPIFSGGTCGLLNPDT